MTTTQELRSALQNIEPGLVGVDVAAVRQQARKVRRKRRLVSVVGGVAAAVMVLLAVPLVTRPHSLPTDKAEVALPGPVNPAGTVASMAPPVAMKPPVRPPLTLADAARATRLAPRPGPLPAAAPHGATAPVGWNGFTVSLVDPPAGPPQVCLSSPTWPKDCSPLRVRADGWVASWRMGGKDATEAPVFGVVRAPVAGVVAAADDTQRPATIRPLGNDYALVVAMMPAQPDIGSITARVRLWVFDDVARLVARYDN